MATDAYDVIDLKAVRCLQAAASHSSLTRAGVELGISEAAVSQRIRSLEKYLGVKLYESRGGKFKLTEAGQYTFEVASRLFDQIDEFEAAIGGEEATSTVTFSATEPVIRYLMPTVVDAFCRDFANARLRLLTRTAANIIELVRRNEIDLGIIPKRPVPAEVTFRPWHTFEAYVLIPRGHPLTKRKVPSIRELLVKDIVESYPLVLPEDNDPDQLRVKAALEREGLPLNVALEVGSAETVKLYVARGHGLAVVPGVCLTHEDRDKFHIIEVPREFEAETTYGLAIHRDKYLSAPLRGLLAILESQSEL